jgi:hypothetical protein
MFNGLMIAQLILSQDVYYGGCAKDMTASS